MPRTREPLTAGTQAEQRINPIRRSFRRFRRSISAQRNKDKQGDTVECNTDEDLSAAVSSENASAQAVVTDDSVFKRPPLPGPFTRLNDTLHTPIVHRVPTVDCISTTAATADEPVALHRGKSLKARARDLFRARSSSRSARNSAAETASCKSNRTAHGSSAALNNARSLSIVAFNDEIVPVPVDLDTDCDCRVDFRTHARHTSMSRPTSGALELDESDQNAIRRSSSFSRSISSLLASVRRRSRSRSGEQSASKATKRHTVCASESNGERYAGIYQSGSRSPSPACDDPPVGPMRPLARSLSSNHCSDSHNTLHQFSLSTVQPDSPLDYTHASTSFNSFASSHVVALNSPFGRHPANARVNSLLDPHPPTVQDLDVQLQQLQSMVHQRPNRLGPLVAVTDIDYTGYRPTYSQHQVCIPAKGVRLWLRSARKAAPQSGARLARSATMRRSASQNSRRNLANLLDSNRYSADTCPLIAPYNSRMLACSSHSPVELSLPSANSDHCLSTSTSSYVTSEVNNYSDCKMNGSAEESNKKKNSSTKAAALTDDCVYVNVRELRQAAMLPPPPGCTYQSFGNPGDTSALSVVREGDLSSVTNTPKSAQTSQLSTVPSAASPNVSDSLPQSETSGSPAHEADPSARSQTQPAANRHSTVTVLSGSSTCTTDSAVELASGASSDRESRTRRKTAATTQNLEPLCESAGRIPVVINIVRADDCQLDTTITTSSSIDAHVGRQKESGFLDSMRSRLQPPRRFADDIVSVNSLDEDGFFSSLTAYSVGQSLVSLEHGRSHSTVPNEQARCTASIWQHRPSNGNVNISQSSNVTTELRETTISSALPINMPCSSMCAKSGDDWSHCRISHQSDGTEKPLSILKRCNDDSASSHANSTQNVSAARSDNSSALRRSLLTKSLHFANDAQVLHLQSDSHGSCAGVPRSVSFGDAQLLACRAATFDCPPMAVQRGHLTLQLQHEAPVDDQCAIATEAVAEIDQAVCSHVRSEPQATFACSQSAEKTKTAESDSSLSVTAPNRSITDETDIDTSLSKLDTSAQLGKLVSRLTAAQVHAPGSPVCSNYRKLYSLSNPVASACLAGFHNGANADKNIQCPADDAFKCSSASKSNGELHLVDLALNESEQDSTDEEVECAQSEDIFSKRSRSYRFAMRHAN